MRAAVSSHKFPAYSLGGATLFDFPMAADFRTGAKSVIYDCFVVVVGTVQVPAVLLQTDNESKLRHRDYDRHLAQYVQTNK